MACVGLAFCTAMRDSAGRLAHGLQVAFLTTYFYYCYFYYYQYTSITTRSIITIIAIYSGD